MSETFASGSILYGRGPDGELRHIEDVERGEACNCVCPDPSCGQTLIARKGTKRAHHFAHKRGTCEWAVEYVVSAVAERVVRKAGAMVFPRLIYRNALNNDEEEELSQSRRMRITSARLVEESGRGNPDLLVTCSDKSGATREFLVVLCLVHGLSRKSKEAIRQSGRDAFAVDLKLLLKYAKDEQGKHYDREKILLGFQDPGFLAGVLTEGRGRCMRWVFNAKAAAAEEESRKKRDEQIEEEKARSEKEQEERRRIAAAKAEADRKAAEKRRAEEAERAAEAAKAAEERRAEEERWLLERAAKQARALQKTQGGGPVTPLRLESTTMKPYAQGCPLHGRADTVSQCGAYSYSTAHCQHFRGMDRSFLYCAAPQDA